MKKRIFVMLLVMLALTGLLPSAAAEDTVQSGFKADARYVNTGRSVCVSYYAPESFTAVGAVSFTVYFDTTAVRVRTFNTAAFGTDGMITATASDLEDINAAGSISAYWMETGTGAFQIPAGTELFTIEFLTIKSTSSTIKLEALDILDGSDEGTGDSLYSLENDSSAVKNIYVTARNYITSATLEESSGRTWVGYSNLKVTPVVTGSSNYASYVPFTYTSSNPEVATVDKNGTVTGVSNGEAVITATSQQFSLEYAVTVHTAAEPVEENRVEPTCTETGSYDTVIYCSDCQEEISREHHSIPVAHSFGSNWVCTICGEPDGEHAFKGVCGEEGTWLLDGDGILKISGIEVIPDYASGGAPWSGYADKIKILQFEMAVTGIGENAFEGCSALSTIEYPGSEAQWNSIEKTSGNDALSSATMVYGIVNITVTTASRAASDSGEVTSIAPLYGGGIYTTGDSVTVTASAVNGYKFTGWYLGEECVGTDYEYTFTAGKADLDLVAVYKSVSMLKLNITGSNFSVNGIPQSGSYSESFPAGTRVTVEYTGDESDFIRWKNEIGSTDSTDATYSFNLISAKTISCVTKVSGIENCAYVEFISAFNQVMGCGTWRGTDKLYQHTLPSGVSKSGYTFGGWQIGDSGEAVQAKDIIEYINSNDVSYVAIKPILVATGTEYTVTLIADGNENGTFTGVDGQGYTFTAPDLSGRKFSHWEDGNGQVLSYLQTYWIRLTSSITLKAVYVDAGEEVTPVPVYALTDIKAVEESGKCKLKFMFIKSIPEDYELVEYGYIRSKNADYSTAETLIKFEDDVPSDCKMGSLTDSTTHEGSFEYSLVVTSNRTTKYYVRGYLRLKFGDQEIIVYSDVREAVYDDLINTDK